MVDFCLLSFPRSGNHMVRFLIEFLTKRATYGCIENSDDIEICKTEFPGGDILGDVDLHNHVAIKCHSVKQIDNYTSQKFLNTDKKLIFILRDPMECIVRHSPSSDHTHTEVIKNVKWYSDLVKYYNEFDGEKILLCYEDFIKRPAESIPPLAKFINADPNKLELLLSNLDYYLYQSRNAVRPWNPIASDNSGSDINYHSHSILDMGGFLKLLREHDLDDHEITKKYFSSVSPE